MHSRKQYTIEYSLQRNLMMVLYSCAIPAAFVTLFFIAIWIWLGTGTLIDNKLAVIFMYAFIPVVTLPFILINFFRQHKLCRKYTYRIESDNILIYRNEEMIVQYDMGNVERYQMLNIGYSIYEAIKVYLKHGAIIYVYSSMNNYRRFLRMLRKNKIHEMRYVNVRLGTYEDNVFKL